MADERISELAVLLGGALDDLDLFEVVDVDDLSMAATGTNKQIAWGQIKLALAGIGGAVDSVNGQTGIVTLGASDVGADPAGTAATLVAALHTADFETTGDGSLGIAAAYPRVGFGVEVGGNNNAHGEVTSPVGGVAYWDFTVVGSDAKSRIGYWDADGTFRIEINGHTLSIASNGTMLLDGDPIGAGVYDPAGSAATAQAAAQTYTDNAVTGLLDLKGSTNASTNPNYPAALKGDAYVVSVAGKVGGASGKSVDVSDVYLATADNAGGNEASVGTSWVVLEHNLVGALLVSDLGSTVQGFSTALAQIAGLSPSNDDIPQRKAGVWTNRTPAQFKLDLALTASDIAVVPAGGLVAVQVQAALEELDGEISGVQTQVDALGLFASLFPGTALGDPRATARTKSGRGRLGSSLNGSITNSTGSVTIRDPKVAPEPMKGLYAIEDEVVFLLSGFDTTSWTIDDTLRNTTAGKSLLATQAVAHSDNAVVRRARELNIAVFGDSIPQGTVNGTDGYMHRAIRAFAESFGGLSSELWPIWRSNPFVTNSASEWSQAGTLPTPITGSNSSNLGPWGVLQFGASSSNIMTWTRPPHIDVATIDVFWIDQGTNSAQWSYSLDGGSTWIDNPVVSTSPANPRLMVTRIACDNPTTFKIRAANAAGTGKSICLPYMGIRTWVSPPVFGVTGGVSFSNLGWDGQKLRSALAARTVTDLITHGTTAAESATASFVAADQTSTIYLTDGTTTHKRTIATRTNSTDIVLSSSVPAGTWHATIFQGDHVGDPLRIFDGDPGALTPNHLYLGTWSNDTTTAGSNGDGNPEAMRNMLQYIVDRVKPYCDITVVASYEQGGGVSGALQQQYRDVCADIVELNGLVLLDLYELFASLGLAGYTAMNGAGLMADTAHLQQDGHDTVATVVERMAVVL